MKNLENDLKSKNLKQIYLFYGEEEFFKKKYEEKFKKFILKDGAETMNLDIFEDNDIDIDEIRSAILTVPFMNEHRLIIVKNSNFFISENKNSTEKIVSFIGSIISTNIIIFLEKKVDKRNKLYKLVSKIGYIAEFKMPKESDLINWIIRVCKKEKRIITKEVARKFINIISLNMNTVDLELDKVISYKDENEEITLEDIELISTKSIDSKIFNLVLSIGNKNCKRALEEYNKLIILKEHPIMILSMITRQFRIILQCKSLHMKGYNVDKISEILSLRSFIVHECIKQSKNFNFKELILALDECLEIDINIKLGKVQDYNLVLEMFIIKYCT